jgi:hypothetical protein
LASDDDSVLHFSHSGLTSLHVDAPAREEPFLVNQPTHLRAIVNQDGAAILDIRSGRITTLNTSGGYVWQALDRGEQIEVIAESLARETGPDAAAVKADVTGFIEALKKQNLLPG